MQAFGYGWHNAHCTKLLDARAEADGDQVISPLLADAANLIVETVIKRA